MGLTREQINTTLVLDRARCRSQTVGLGGRELAGVHGWRASPARPSCRAAEDGWSNEEGQNSREIFRLSQQVVRELHRFALARKRRNQRLFGGGKQEDLRNNEIHKKQENQENHKDHKNHNNQRLGDKTNLAQNEAVRLVETEDEGRVKETTSEEDHFDKSTVQDKTIDVSDETDEAVVDLAEPADGLEEPTSEKTAVQENAVEELSALDGGAFRRTSDELTEVEETKVKEANQEGSVESVVLEEYINEFSNEKEVVKEDTLEEEASSEANKDETEEADIKDILLDGPVVVQDTSDLKLVVEQAESEECIEEAVKEEGIEETVESEPVATEDPPCNTIFRSVLTNNIIENNSTGSNQAVKKEVKEWSEWRADQDAEGLETEAENTEDRKETTDEGAVTDGSVEEGEKEADEAIFKEVERIEDVSSIEPFIEASEVGEGVANEADCEKKETVLEAVVQEEDAVVSVQSVNMEFETATEEGLDKEVSKEAVEHIKALEETDGTERISIVGLEDVIIGKVVEELNEEGSQEKAAETKEILEMEVHEKSVGLDGNLNKEDTEEVGDSEKVKGQTEAPAGEKHISEDADTKEDETVRMLVVQKAIHENTVGAAAELTVPVEVLEEEPKEVKTADETVKQEYAPAMKEIPQVEEAMEKKGVQEEGLREEAATQVADSNAAAVNEERAFEDAALNDTRAQSPELEKIGTIKTKEADAVGSQTDGELFTDEAHDKAADKDDEIKEIDVPAKADGKYISEEADTTEEETVSMAVVQEADNTVQAADAETMPMEVLEEELEEFKNVDETAPQECTQAVGAGGSSDEETAAETISAEEKVEETIAEKPVPNEVPAVKAVNKEAEATEHVVCDEEEPVKNTPQAEEAIDNKYVEEEALKEAAIIKMDDSNSIAVDEEKASKSAVCEEATEKEPEGTFIESDNPVREADTVGSETDGKLSSNEAHVRAASKNEEIKEVHIPAPSEGKDISEEADTKEEETVRMSAVQEAITEKSVGAAVEETMPMEVLEEELEVVTTFDETAQQECAQAVGAGGSTVEETAVEKISVDEKVEETIVEESGADEAPVVKAANKEDKAIEEGPAKNIPQEEEAIEKKADEEEALKEATDIEMVNTNDTAADEETPEIEVELTNKAVVEEKICVVLAVEEARAKETVPDDKVGKDEAGQDLAVKEIEDDITTAKEGKINKTEPEVGETKEPEALSETLSKVLTSSQSKARRAKKPGSARPIRSLTATMIMEPQPISKLIEFKHLDDKVKKVIVEANSEGEVDSGNDAGSNSSEDENIARADTFASVNYLEDDLAMVHTQNLKVKMKESESEGICVIS